MELYRRTLIFSFGTFPVLKTLVCDKPAKATGTAWKIKALRFSKIILEILFLIFYHLNEFR